MGKAKEREHQPGVEDLKSGQLYNKVSYKYTTCIIIANTIILGSPKSNKRKFASGCREWKEHYFYSALLVLVTPTPHKRETKNINKLLKIKRMKTKKQNNQVTNLRNANKEVKSISGVIKLIKTFWSAGYKEAFTPFGVTFKSELKDITALCQKDSEGNIYIIARKAKKDSEGNIILDKEGKKIMEQYNKVVTNWSATTLYKVLEQTIKKNNI